MATGGTLKQTKKIYCNDGHYVKIGTGNVSITTNTFIQNTQSFKSICFEVYLPEHNFTGRDAELLLLDNALHRSSVNAFNNVEDLITVVSGLGGMGKTQLVREYVNRNGSKFDGNIIWINAESEESIIDTFKRVAKDFLFIQTIDANGTKKSISSIIQSVYDYFRNKNVLFIFDNVESMDSIRKFLCVVHGPSNSSRVYFVFTSRVQEWCDGIERIQLNEWQSEEATKFVSALLTNAEDDVENIKLLTDMLQCFPLTLRQATSYIRYQRETDDYTISNYLTMYEQQIKEVLNSNAFRNNVNAYAQTTFTTWNITINAIGRDSESGSLALKILYTIAYFAPDNIYRESLLNLVNEPKESTIRLLGKQLTRLVISEVLGVPNVTQPPAKRPEALIDNRKSLKSAVHLLVKYSMISSRDRQRILNIHRVVQDVIRTKLKADNKERVVLRNALILVDKLMKRVSHTEHAVSVFRYALRYTDLTKEFYALPNVILMNIITENNNRRQAVSFGHQVLSKFESIFSPNHRIMESIKFNVMLAKHLYGRDEFLIRNEFAYQMYDELYKMRMTAFGQNDVDTLAVKLIIGYILMYMRRTSEAIKTFEEILAKYREINDDYLEGTALYKLAETYIKFRLYDEGLKKAREWLEKYKRKLGENHPLVIAVLNHTAAALVFQRNYTEALHMLEKISDKGVLIGEDSECILNTLQNIGHIYNELGNFQKSLEVSKSVHLKRVQLNGENHEATLVSLYNIGCALKGQLNYTEALRIFEDLSEKETLLGGDYVCILSVLYKIAEIHYKLHNFEKSLEVAKRVYDKRVELFGKNHLDTLRVYCIIGCALQGQGNYTEALHIFEKISENEMLLLQYDDNTVIQVALDNIVRIAEKIENVEKTLEILKGNHPKRVILFGENHPDTLKVLNDIGNSLLKQGNYSDALNVFETIAEKSTHLASDNQIVLTTLYNMGQTFHKLGSHEKSLEILRDVCGKYALLLGENHRCTLAVSDHIAVILVEQGNHTDALSIFEKILENEMLIGENNPVVLNVLHNIGKVHYKLGNYKKSLEIFKGIHMRSVQLFGECDPRTLGVFQFYYNIGMAFLQQGSYTDALHGFEEISEKRMLLGEDNQIVLDSLHHIGHIHYKLEHFEKALEIYKDIHAKCVKMFGECHPYTLSWCNVVGSTLLRQGNYTEALHVFEKVSQRAMLLANDNVTSLCALHNIGYTHYKLGNYENSLEVSRSVYTERVKLLGETHPSTLSVHNNIGLALLEQGHYSDALDIFTETYKHKNELGEFNDITIEAMEGMGSTYSKLGKYRDSLDIQKEIYATRVKQFGENHPETQRVNKSIEDTLSAQTKNIDLLNVNLVLS